MPSQVKILRDIIKERGLVNESLEEVKGAENEKVMHYVMRFYFTAGDCTLCGNRGIIDTRGVKTADGIEVGARNFCLCPNGQRDRRVFGAIEKFDECKYNEALNAKNEPASPSPVELGRE